ncbi:hypothetical protein SANTM175S_00516 [Streptomyces antimycoticus]
MTTALIIGGGIAGPVTAMALRKAGIDAVVYETYPTDATDAGAFLVVAANGLEALRTIDAHEPVLKNSFPVGRVEFISDTGKRLGNRPMSGSQDGGLGSGRQLKRATLARVLGEEAMRRGVRIEHERKPAAGRPYQPDGQIVCSFADGGRRRGRCAGRDRRRRDPLARPQDHRRGRAPAPLHRTAHRLRLHPRTTPRHPRTRTPTR